MTELKRLEELRLNDTIYHDYYDMHSYDGNGPLYDLYIFSLIIIITIIIIIHPHVGCVDASSVLLGLCPDYSRDSLAFRIPDICIATVSKRLSDFPLLDDLGWPTCMQIANFLTPMVERKKKNYED
jgi:hypothetical protein